jgi:hypothetical protein
MLRVVAKIVAEGSRRRGAASSTIAAVIAVKRHWRLIIGSE